MNPGTFTGVLTWLLVVGVFYAGSKWGRARERYEAQRREARLLAAKHQWDSR